MLAVTTTCGSWATARVSVCGGITSCPHEASPWAFGEPLNLSTVGDDAWITYGRAMSVIMHAALAGDGLDQVPFLLNSPIKGYCPC